MNANKVLGHFISEGISLHKWSAAHGYKFKTVYAVLARWADKKGQPRGALTKQILTDLEKEVGSNIYQRAA